MKFLILALILACSSPTPYQKKKKGEGYVDTQSGVIHSTEFHANSHTKVKDALTMAQYRATHVCSPDLTYFLATEDLSRIKEITRTSGTTPYYNTGYYPYRRGWSLGVGFGSYSAESWKDQLIYPRIKVSYLCGNQFFAPDGNFKSVTAADLSHIYKDLLGAIVAEDVPSGSPLEKGDIILKMNGKRVESLADFYFRFQEKPKSNLEILRGGKRQVLEINAKDVTEEVKLFDQDINKRMCKIDKGQCTKED